MLIAEAQVHIWGANTPERPWPAGQQAPHRPVPFTKDDLLHDMDAAGVHRAMIVPPAWEGGRNDLALAAARAHPDRFAVMGRIDVYAPQASHQIRTCRNEAGMLGLRLNFKAQGFPQHDGLWTAAAEGGVPIMVSVTPAQLHVLDQIAQRHPGLKLAIDHLGIPESKKDAAAFAHMDQLLRLARRPNISVKASSLPSYTTDSYPYPQLHPYIRRVYDVFGPRRMFWGTDYTRLPCSYRQAITMFTEGMPWLTAKDQDWIMGRALCEWSGWKLPPAP